MVIHRPKSVQEAVSLRHSIENSAYLAGGTEDLRLGSSVSENAELIDINKLGLNAIKVEGNNLYIGSCVTFQDLVESDLVPSFIKEAAGFCASYEKRNSATIGGNIATNRCDSYLIPALVAADAKLIIECKKGEKDKSITEYLSKPCKAVIKSIVIDKDRKGWSKRISHTSTSHATLIASHSKDIYALEASGSKLCFGNSPKIYEEMEFVTDLTGSAEYKKYLASVIFDLEGK